MNDWLLTPMITKYVEERFSTYTTLMESVLEAKESNIQEDEKIIARLSNFLTFSDKVGSEIKNIFGVEVAIDMQEHDDSYRNDCRVFATHIMYKNMSVGRFGFSVEKRLLVKYITEGNKYERIN